MTPFFESPWPGGAVGVVLTVMMVAGYLRTGRPAPLAAAGGALILGAGLVCLAIYVETDREQIDATIHDLARKLEANRDQEVLDAIHSGAPEVKRRAASELIKYSIDEVKVKSNLKIEVQIDHQPPRAVATFKVVGRIQEYPRPIPRSIKLVFYRDPEGVWRIIDYSHHSSDEGFRVQER